jgi:integrase
MNAEKILTRTELAAVIADLRRKRRRAGSRLNLVIVRLASCCGLRVAEIAALRLNDLQLDGERPVVVVRRGKGGKRRSVPLWWDGSTLVDLVRWKVERESAGAKPTYPVIANLHGRRGVQGGPLTTRAIQKRWKTSTRLLGVDRCRTLSIHSGRHSFASHALAGGRTIAEVRDALGHSSLSVTSVYTHVIDDGGVGDLFAFAG